MHVCHIIASGEVSSMKYNHTYHTQHDATLVEINPLALTDGGNIVCMDAKFNFDDNAKFRQPEIFQMRDPSQV